jgi:hypothetical protein
MRALVRRLDALLRRRLGVFEFCDDPECLLRLRLARAPHDLLLPDATVCAGEPVLELHLWNEQLPLPPRAGPDLAWAVRLHRLWVKSLRLVAQHIGSDAHLAGVRALGGSTVLADSEEVVGRYGLFRRLGFAVLPAKCTLGCFGEFWKSCMPGSSCGRSTLPASGAGRWQRCAGLKTGCRQTRVCTDSARRAQTSARSRPPGDSAWS